MIAQPQQLREDPRPVAAAAVAAAPARAALSPTEAAKRMEELGRIILAYSEVTERLQQSHEQLRKTVEHLRQELSEKNRLLERKNRLAALGEMAAGLAHEIRNPLGGIQLYASMLAHDLADREEPLRTVRKISAGVKRLEALVGQVLQFTREIAVNPEPADLSQIVAQAVEYAQKSLNDRGVECRVEGPRPLLVNVDPLLLGQSVLNLVLNAAEAIESGDGSIHVQFARRPESSGARQFHLSVRDSGPGIEPEILERIFNPFFTTKETGTGLGLAIVHRIVEAHDGTITASNEDGGGARFEIRI
ncbi:MAG TPA: ATP-binding protein [Tepidisphaeraceae bacterium]|jgi:signal transduction histidine kinase